MIVIGLDIGTTTVSAVALREGAVLSTRTLPNDAFLSSRLSWERLQDPVRILTLARLAMEDLLAQFPQAECIGVTGQMHGIVYLDVAGKPVSPLYTWQDGRGDLMPEGSGESYAQRLSLATGYSMSTGYGLTTHFYLSSNNLVPKDAVTFCTIGDYVAMTLAGRTSPLLDASNAASLGLFSLEAKRFDTAAMAKIGLDSAMLPHLADSPWLGSGPLGRSVSVAIGDNQASYLGAYPETTDHILVNVGTGSQFSARIDHLSPCHGLEHRPFPLGGYLLVGSSLCGGRAYALLEQFFRQTVEMATGLSSAPCYGAMAKLLDMESDADDIPTVRTTFQGTREAPTLRGSIQGLSTDNLTPRHLALGFLHGMADELHEMYAHYQEVAGPNFAATFVGSGNGLRHNPHLQRIMAQRFGLPLTLSQNEEEAAYGVGLFILANR